ncbi:MAG: helix-turn-helix domain-containing protein [Paracoccaceae bacterium]
MTGTAIRSGALTIPLNFAFERHRNECTKLHRELVGIEIPDSAESLMPVGDYLEILDRIDRFGVQSAELLQASLSQDFRDLGLLGKAVVHAENLWNALQLIRDGLSYFQPGSEIDIRIHRGRCRVTYQNNFGDGHPPALDTQYTIGLLTNVLMECDAIGSANVQICYPGALVDHSIQYSSFASVSDSARGMIEFDDQILRSPLRRRIPYMSDILCDVVGSISGDETETMYYSRLVGLLQAASLERQRMPLTQAKMADLLDVSVRMLQVKLKSEGSRFDKIRDATRHRVASGRLLEGKDIIEVAAHVGFAHRQGFSEAFSKWEGMSPSEFRSRSASEMKKSG